MRSVTFFATSIATAFVLASSVVAVPTEGVQKPKVIMRPQPRTNTTIRPNSGDNIAYNVGAQVLTAPLNIYYIYYGSWASSQKAILEDFMRGLGESDWWRIIRGYYFQQNSASSKVYVNGGMRLAKTVSDNYSLGKSLSGNAIPNLIQAQISSGALPEDSDGVYVVLTSGDVQESMRADSGPGNMCSDYCGYHLSWQLSSGKRITYVMVGNPTPCLNGCAPRQNARVSPNGDVAVDGMLSALAHEVAETVTDPWSEVQRAWQDSDGEENGDKCAYTYGSTSLDNRGAAYNVEWSGRNYLIQQMWDPVSQSCRLSPGRNNNNDDNHDNNNNDDDSDNRRHHRH